ncbi:MAG: hypothetical protein ABR501_03380 [Pyrinomonadaceae bacterium]
MMTRLERPAVTSATVRVTMLLFLCACFFSVGAAGVDTTPAAHPEEQNRKAAGTLQLSLAIADQKYCPQVIDERTREERLSLVLRLRVTNTSGETLILHRYGQAIFNVRLAKTTGDIRSRNYVYDVRSTLMRPTGALSDKFQESEPTDKFRILQPNDSFEYELPDPISITITPAVEPSQKLSNGDYFLQVKAQTWSGERKKAEALRQRWASRGRLWYYDLLSLPLKIKIERPASMTVPCQ